jgi:hypothetical protein
MVEDLTDAIPFACPDGSVRVLELIDVVDVGVCALPAVVRFVIDILKVCPMIFDECEMAAVAPSEQKVPAVEEASLRA